MKYSIIEELAKKRKNSLLANATPQITTPQTVISGAALKRLIRSRLFYISHPSLSSLECSINLNSNSTRENFDCIVETILALSNFNSKEVERNDKTFCLNFKDVAAMKLLNIVFKDDLDHALYPIYLAWILGSEWMTTY
jgi:hypothetical protein